jgi:hypothetical protein
LRPYYPLRIIRISQAIGPAWGIFIVMRAAGEFRNPSKKGFEEYLVGHECQPFAIEE